MRKNSQVETDLQEENLARLIASVAKKRHTKTVRKHYGEANLLQMKREAKWKNQEIEGMDIQDFLKTASHQKKVLSTQKWKKLCQIHENYELQQINYKYLVIVGSQANYRKLDHPGYYKELLKYTKQYPQYFFCCIEKDIPRTLPNGHPFQPALRNILSAYSIRNPSLLYCQGMNYIVCFMLINGLSEEEAFWLMVTLIEDIVMPDYFKDLSTISITSQIFDDLLKEIFPEFASELEEVGMQSNIFLISWYVCLFTKGFINSVSQYLLEEIILQSRQYSICFILIKISVGIITALFMNRNFEYEKDFKSLKDTIEEKVQQISLEEIKNALNFFQLDYESFSLVEKHYKKKRQKVYGKALNKQLNEKKLSLPSCSTDYPVCLQRIQIQKKIGSIEEVLILKNDFDIKSQYIEDYFPKNVNRGNGLINYSEPSECPIIHHTHVCETEKKELNNQIKLKQEETKPINECESSIELNMRFSKIEDKYNEFSEYFIIDESQENNFEDKIELTSSIEFNEKDEKEKSKFIQSIGNVFKKALKGIKLLKDEQ